jgi:hypothetical protein
VAAGAVLLTVDAHLAALGNATPAALAQSWAANLKQVLAVPYLTLDPHDQLAVPLGETRTLRWGGTASASISFVSQDPAIADIQLAANGQSLLVQGLSVGDTYLLASLGSAQVRIAIEVKAWAARVQRQVVAEVSSPPLPADDLRRTLRNAVLLGLTPAVGATVALDEPQRQGDSWTVGVHASGSGCFDVNDVVTVRPGAPTTHAGASRQQPPRAHRRAGHAAAREAHRCRAGAPAVAPRQLLDAAPAFCGAGDQPGQAAGLPSCYRCRHRPAG